MDQFILSDYEKRMQGAIDNLVNNFTGLDLEGLLQL